MEAQPANDSGNGEAVREAPRLDELIARTQLFLTTTLTQTVKEPVGEVGRWIARRVLGFALATVFLASAAGFLLFGLMMMLSQWMPTFGACLLVGGVSLLLGILFLRSTG
ncbi:MAG: hypothetical protein AB2A00_11325 [Myxococcota bacterium]